MEDAFRSRIEALPDPTRRLLLVAAAEPTGDSALMWRAASQLGIGPDAATAAVEAELSSFASRVRFRHPLVRSAAYRSAPLRDRQQAHLALAAATDAHLDPDRRAWHLANAAPGPDDDIAAELDRSADRARARGGIGAAAAFLERAASAHHRPRAHGASGHWLQHRPRFKRAHSTSPSICWRWQRLHNSAIFSRRRPTSCERRSRSLPGMAATPRHCS